MKLFKKTLMIAFAISVLSLTGCVSVTSSPDLEDSFYEDPTPVTAEHKYFHSIEVGKTEGFKGTNPFWISGKVAPNMSNETAKEALEKTLYSSNMLAGKGEAKYQLEAIMKDDDAKGVLGGGSTLTGLSRDMSIQYILKTLNNTTELYNEIIVSHGEAGCSDQCFVYLLQEKIAAERSNVDSHRQLIEALKNQ